MVVALFRMPYNLLTSLIPVIQIHITIYRTSIDGSIFSCTTCIVYQYFKELGCFHFKSGCKGKGFYFNYQMFSEVFFRFSFSIVSQTLLAKGKEGKEEKQNDFSLRIGLQR